jgi:hypothetical protein
MTKFLMSIAFVVASLSITSSASALHIRARGSTHLTATGGAVRLDNDSGSQTLQCTTTGARTDLRRRANGTPPVAISHNVKLTITGCTIGGVVGITISCNSSARLNVTGGSATAVHGTITGIVCDMRLGAGTTSTCHISTAAGAAGSATQRITYNNAGRIILVPGGATDIQFTGSLSGCTLKNSTRARLSNSNGTPLQMTISPTVTLDLT